MALKTLKQSMMIYVDENGGVSQKKQTIYIDTAGHSQFVIKFPEHVCKAMGWKAEVRAEKAADIVSLYTRKMNEYKDWLRTAKAEPVILLKTNLRTRDRSSSDRARHDIDTTKGFFDTELRDCAHVVDISMSYLLCFRVNGVLFHRKKNLEKEGEFLVGDRMYYPDGVVLDYMPELEHRLDLICVAFEDAARALHEIVESKNVSKALLDKSKLWLTGPSTRGDD